MAKRPFSYDKTAATLHVETAVNSYKDRIHIEYTNPTYVNLGFEAMVTTSGQGTAGWVSVERGQMLDDLITALIYFRDEGESIFDGQA